MTRPMISSSRWTGMVLALFWAFVATAQAVPADDSFIAGYATAIVEREFHSPDICLTVQDRVITIGCASLGAADRDRLRKVLSAIQGVRSVVFSQPLARRDNAVSRSRERAGVQTRVSPPNPEVLPKGRLFDALIADPIWPHFSVSYLRCVDHEEMVNLGKASFGEGLGLYRDTAPFGGLWQFGIQGAVFAIFDLDAESMDLINADYWVGFPLSYRNGPFSALTRVFHQSSHLGDEYLLRERNEGINRVNLSYEGVDLRLSYEIGTFRLYGGGVYLFHRTPSELKPWSSQIGLEYESPDTYMGGMFRPVAGIDLKSHEEHDWETDVSLRMGVQLESLKTVGHDVQILMEYFNGNTPSGQFYEQEVEHIGLGTHFYF